MNATAIEPRLVDAAKSGDRQAIGELLRVADPELRAALYDSVPPRLAPIVDLTDLLQVTYLEAAPAVKNFDDRGSGSFVAWLVGIARNNLRDALLESKRKKRTPSDGRAILSLNNDAHLHLLEKLRKSSASASRAYSRFEAQETLRRAIDKLPPDYRAVIELRDLQEQTVSQTALKMRRSVGAICLLRARALEHLAVLLDADPSLSAT